MKRGFFHLCHPPGLAACACHSTSDAHMSWATMAVKIKRNEPCEHEFRNWDEVPIRGIVPSETPIVSTTLCQHSCRDFGAS